MYFSKLPEHIKEAITKLPQDDVFQERFAKDKRLDEIDEMKENLGEEYRILLAVLKKTLSLENMQIKHITPGVWSYLWVISSPFVWNKVPEPHDADLFLYIIENGIKDGDPIKLLNESTDYAAKKYKLNFIDSCKVIFTLIKYAFRPLHLFPAASGANNKPSFDADWLTGMVAKVHNVTGYTPDYIINELPLCACCYYFAQYCRQQGSDNIHKRTDEEILILQMERSVELICERLIELDVFPIEEYEKWKTVMMTKPTKDGGK